MDELETFLTLYGLGALFLLMLAKAIGVPIPIPADVIMLAAAARVAAGKMVLWQVFVVLFVALVGGGLVQFALARRLGRPALYRFGRFLGLTAERLDIATARTERAGTLGVGLAVLTPGARAAAVAACGLADLPLRVFVPGLVLGGGLFLGLHLAIGFLGAPFLAVVAEALSLPWLAGVAGALLLAGLVGWLAIRWRQRPTARRTEVVAEAVEAWHEAACPLCLALGASSRLAGEH